MFSSILGSIFPVGAGACLAGRGRFEWEGLGSMLFPSARPDHSAKPSLPEGLQYPQPSTLNPQPSTLNPQPSTPNPQPPKPQTLNQTPALNPTPRIRRMQCFWDICRSPSPMCPAPTCLVLQSPCLTGLGVRGFRWV